MRKYWIFMFYVEDKEKIRYFYGTEAAVIRRVKRTTGEGKHLAELHKPLVDYLKTEKKVRFVDL
ncbi:MAG TPA: hypothetical protein VN426_17855 [Syntrophomonadaceae bacterium]|nr:hypothetical protein [Syntrophomonadaceae bacterium]